MKLSNIILLGFLWNSVLSMIFKTSQSPNKVPFRKLRSVCSEIKDKNSVLFNSDSLLKGLQGTDLVKTSCEGDELIKFNFKIAGLPVTLNLITEVFSGAGLISKIDTACFEIKLKLSAHYQSILKCIEFGTKIIQKAGDTLRKLPDIAKNRPIALPDDLLLTNEKEVGSTNQLTKLADRLLKKTWTIDSKGSMIEENVPKSNGYSFWSSIFGKRDNQDDSSKYDPAVQALINEPLYVKNVNAVKNRYEIKNRYESNVGEKYEDEYNQRERDRRNYYERQNIRNNNMRRNQNQMQSNEEFRRSSQTKGQQTGQNQGQSNSGQQSSQPSQNQGQFNSGQDHTYLTKNQGQIFQNSQPTQVYQNNGQNQGSNLQGTGQSQYPQQRNLNQIKPQEIIAYQPQIQNINSLNTPVYPRQPLQPSIPQQSMIAQPVINPESGSSVQAVYQLKMLNTIQFKNTQYQSDEDADGEGEQEGVEEEDSRDTQDQMDEEGEVEGVEEDPDYCRKLPLLNSTSKLEISKDLKEKILSSELETTKGIKNRQTDLLTHIPKKIVKVNKSFLIGSDGKTPKNQVSRNLLLFADCNESQQTSILSQIQNDIRRTIAKIIENHKSHITIVFLKDKIIEIIKKTQTSVAKLIDEVVESREIEKQGNDKQIHLNVYNPDRTWEFNVNVQLRDFTMILLQLSSGSDILEIAIDRINFETRDFSVELNIQLGNWFNLNYQKEISEFVKRIVTVNSESSDFSQNGHTSFSSFIGHFDNFIQNKVKTDILFSFGKTAGPKTDKIESLSGSILLNVEELKSRPVINAAMSLDGEFDILSQVDEAYSPYNFLAVCVTQAQSQLDVDFGSFFGSFPANLVALSVPCLAVSSIKKNAQITDRNEQKDELTKNLVAQMTNKQTKLETPNKIELAYFFESLWRILYVKIWHFENGFFEGFLIKFTTQFFTAEFFVPNAPLANLAGFSQDLIQQVMVHYQSSIQASIKPVASNIDLFSFPKILFDSISQINKEKTIKVKFNLCQLTQNQLVLHFLRVPFEDKTDNINECTSEQSKNEEIVSVSFPADTNDFSVTIYSKDMMNKHKKSTKITYTMQKETKFDSISVLKKFFQNNILLHVAKVDARL